MNTQRAIFLDRDGVISVNRSDYVKTWDEFVFLPRSLEALRDLAASHFVIAVTTNQSVVARGLATEKTLREIHGKMMAQVKRAGGRIDAVYYCPHRPEDACECRKPKPGMYLRAAQEHGIALARSYVIGDAREDVAAAQAIGAKPILVLTGRGAEQHAAMMRDHSAGYIVVDDLMRAVEWIAREEKF
jgi:D-glycero-D-manno-heptose 1,7-bisphosphate phosphatase